MDETSQEVGTVISPTLQVLKRKHRGAKEVAQCNRATGRVTSQNSFSDRLGY